MSKNKTTENSDSVIAYLNNIVETSKRRDCYQLMEFMQAVSGFEPKMWGTGIVGFGSYHYTYESGRKGDAPLAAFASRANSITIYVSLKPGLKEALLARFGKHKTSEACIYIQKLEHIDLEVLREMVAASIQDIKVNTPLIKVACRPQTIRRIHRATVSKR